MTRPHQRAFRRGHRPAAAEPAPPPRPTVTPAQHNRMIRAAEKRALELEDRMVDVLVPILDRAADVAARNFQARAVSHMAASLRQDMHLVASGDVTSTSTMVAVKPRPDEAAALAQDGGADPENLHVTLAYLGDTTGPLDEIANAIARAAATHAPLEGRVGGAGVFADNGSGYPSILLPSVPGLLELRQHVTQGLTDAAISYGREHGFQPHITVGYQDGPETPPLDLMGTPLHFDDLHVVRGDAEHVVIPLVGSRPVTAAARALSELEQAVADVAEEHAPDGGYGDTWWSEDEATVYWICGDWSTDAEIGAAEDAFLDVDGVEEVETCDECGAPRGDGWARVWPASALTAAATGSEFCLPEQLRGKTDPVRQAVVQTVMAGSVEGVGINFDVTSPFAEKVLAQSASQIGHISQTTQLDVMRIIRQSFEQGYSIPDTAKAIRAAMKESSPIRARLIARTELAGAVNGGSLAATQIVQSATGDTYEKVWMTAPGAKYPRHYDYEGLDGQATTLDGYFDVGGSDLQFPGDPAGPPEEVCNCRCALRYGPDGEAGSEVLAAACGAHDADYVPPADELDRLVASLTAATSGPGWSAPAPEEVLSVNCGQPGASPTPAAHAQPVQGADRPAGDTVSVEAGPRISESALAKIQQLGLDDWPPPKGPVAERLLGSATDTLSIYKTGDVWEDSRAAVQQAIIDRHLAGKVAADEKQAFFTAGGGASGKSSARFVVDGQELSIEDLAAREDTVLVDPDAIKEMLPEYQQMRDAGDAYAAYGVHEESSAIAKMIVVEARSRGISIVLDTTGSSGGFVKKIEAVVNESYEAHVTMVSAPTNEAIMRSVARGDRTGRYLAINSIKHAHAGASKQLEVWMHDPNVAAWRIYDTGGTSGHATLVATGGGGQAPVVYDQAKLDAILAKADE